MTNITGEICRVYRNNFKRHYLRKKRLFLIFIAFLKCAWNLEHFQINDEYPSLIISEIIDVEKRGYLPV